MVSQCSVGRTYVEWGCAGQHYFLVFLKIGITRIFFQDVSCDPSWSSQVLQLSHLLYVCSNCHTLWLLTLTFMRDTRINQETSSTLNVFDNDVWATCLEGPVRRVLEIGNVFISHYRGGVHSSWWESGLVVTAYLPMQMLTLLYRSDFWTEQPNLRWSICHRIYN